MWPASGCRAGHIERSEQGTTCSATASRSWVCFVVLRTLCKRCARRQGSVTMCIAERHTLRALNTQLQSRPLYMDQIWYRDDQFQFGGRKLHIPWCATPSSAEKPFCVGSQTRLLWSPSEALCHRGLAIPSPSRGITRILALHCVRRASTPSIARNWQLHHGASRCGASIAWAISCVGAALAGRNEASSSWPCWASADVTAAQPYQGQRQSDPDRVQQARWPLWAHLPLQEPIRSNSSSNMTHRSKPIRAHSAPFSTISATWPSQPPQRCS
jgi:hypothetical protein